MDSKTIIAQGSMVRCKRVFLLGALAVLASLTIWAAPVRAQVDICGCKDNPGSLGNFDAADQSTWPPGSILQDYYYLRIPLPEDGVLIFDNFHAGMRNGYSTYVQFIHNSANTPVTLLVSGDFTIDSGCSIDINGNPGQNGGYGLMGKGGLGGPGGFRGGDGAFQAVNLSRDGAAGLGPGGGNGGFADMLTDGAEGTFFGVPELRPLIGGAGGGGGASSLNDTYCAGGGGGGGGGAILIAANGTISIRNGGAISANGGYPGYSDGAYYSCASNGGYGSGGAIRLVANTVLVEGTVQARGSSNLGSIRVEAPSTDFSLDCFSPYPKVFPMVGPLTNPFLQTLAITSINGQAVPVFPRGVFGEIDLNVTTAGPTSFQLESKGIPSGTGIEVKIKPRLGGALISGNATINSFNCDISGTCISLITFDLPSGAYTAEARATFAIP